MLLVLFAKKGYKVTRQYDKEVATIAKVAYIASQHDHTQYDSFVFYFSGHGDDGVICGNSDAPGEPRLKISEIVSLFEPQHCPTLAEKPKVFRTPYYLERERERHDIYFVCFALLWFWLFSME